MDSSKHSYELESIKEANILVYLYTKNVCGPLHCHPCKRSQQVLTEWEYNKYLLNKINEVANRKTDSPTHGSTQGNPDTVEISSIYREPAHHMQTCFRRTMVLVMRGLAHAMSTGPWNHLLGLVLTRPTVKKHHCTTKQLLRSGKSNEGCNLFQSN